ncbi:MAG: hypothetical protein ABIQ16_09485 [Polyangiaceae bacterium]
MSNQSSGVSRTLSGVLLLTLCLATMAQKRPSSLHRPEAMVHVSHRNELVTRCRSDARGTACIEHRAKAAAGGDLIFTPLTDPLISTPTEDRAEVRLSLPSSLGSSSIDAPLAAGTWQLAWADQRVGLRVPRDGQFQLRLSTVSGHCVRQDSGCKLESNIIHREIVVPPELALGVAN